MKARRVFVGVVSIIALLVACSPTSYGSVLYTNDGPRLFTVSQTTGATNAIGSCNCNFEAEALAWRPGHSTALYGLVNSTSGPARLARINATNGQFTLFPPFDESVLGFAEPFANGIAISPLNPNIAIVTGFDAGFDFTNPANASPTAGQDFVWTVDLISGTVLTAGISNSSEVEKITYAPDGVTLFGVDDSGRLVTLDPATGTAALVGDPGLTDFIEGLAFRPEDGALFALNGGTADNIVVLNPLDGSVVTALGTTHRGGAHGLAFLIPEASTLVLLCAGFAVLPFQRQIFRRCHRNCADAATRV